MKNSQSKVNRADLVYKIVTQIPVGHVLTYGIIARLSGLKSARTVGYYLHNNPDPENIPCHRVVNFQGKVAQNFAYGGANGQIQKLTNEGILIKNNTVDLQTYLWKS
jgi:methylated-DNA-protein-cysteine methyltransferase related protein